jgi:Ca-activated chloride channel homolog
MVWRRPTIDPPWRAFVDAQLLPYVLNDGGGSRRRVVWLVLLASGWLLSILALAGPQFGGGQVADKSLPRLQVLLIEIPEEKTVSAKTLARFEVILGAAQKMVSHFNNQETAVLLYAQQPFLIVPPTRDRPSVEGLLRDLTPGLLPAYGARPDRALAMVSEVLRRNQQARADLHWITAGNVAQLELPALVDRVSVFYYGDDEALAAQLKAYAQGRSGAFVAAPQGEVPDFLQAEDAPAQTSPDQNRGEAFAAWLVLLILSLAFLGFRSVAYFGLCLFALSGGLMFPNDSSADSLPLPVSANPARSVGASESCQQAATAYREGRYAEAGELWAGCPGADAIYNRGNALAKSGRLQEAIGAYDKALQIRPDDADFGFNRGVVQSIIKPPPPPPPPPPKPSPGAAVSPTAAFSEQGAPDQKSSGQLLDVRRTSPQAVSKSEEARRDFLRHLILLQEMARK